MMTLLLVLCAIVLLTGFVNWFATCLGMESTYVHYSGRVTLARIWGTSYPALFIIERTTNWIDPMPSWNRAIWVTLVCVLASVLSELVSWLHWGNHEPKAKTCPDCQYYMTDVVDYCKKDCPKRSSCAAGNRQFKSMAIEDAFAVACPSCGERVMAIDLITCSECGAEYCPECKTCALCEVDDKPVPEPTTKSVWNLLGRVVGIPVWLAGVVSVIPFAAFGFGMYLLFFRHERGSNAFVDGVVTAGVNPIAEIFGSED